MRARGTALEAVQVVRAGTCGTARACSSGTPSTGTICSETTRSPTAIPHRLRGLVVQFDNLADEFVAGDDHRLGPGGAVLVAPELRGAVVALQVTGADADGLDPDQRLARSACGHRDLFEPVVVRSVADDGLHLLRDLVGHQQAPGVSFRLVTIRLPDCGWSHTIA